MCRRDRVYQSGYTNLKSILLFGIYTLNIFNIITLLPLRHRDTYRLQQAGELELVIS